MLLAVMVASTVDGWTIHFVYIDGVRGDLASCVWFALKLHRDNCAPTEEAGNYNKTVSPKLQSANWH